MIRYLDYETVVAVNAEHGGDGAGVRDESGIRAALGRAEASFAGTDLYPSVLEKAAVLLHGLSTTQYFFDGNKRTAWLVAKLFLGLNANLPRPVAPIEAESFVLAIATRAFEVDNEPQRGIDKARDWFDSVRLRATDRVEWAMLATRFRPDERGDNPVFSAEGVGIDRVELGSFPQLFPVFLVVELRFFLSDLLQEHTISVELSTREDKYSGVRLPEPGEQVGGVIPASMLLPDERRPGRLLRLLPHFALPIEARLPREVTIRVLLNGEEAAALPFTIAAVPTVPDSLADLQLGL